MRVFAVACSYRGEGEVRRQETDVGRGSEHVRVVSERANE